jgi:hypothetical protein
VKRLNRIGVMFTNLPAVHILGRLVSEGKAMASRKSRIIYKHFRLDSIKLKRAQKVLEARTDRN